MAQLSGPVWLEGAFKERLREKIQDVGAPVTDNAFGDLLDSLLEHMVKEFDGNRETQDWVREYPASSRRGGLRAVSKSVKFTAYGSSSGVFVPHYMRLTSQ